MTTGKARALTIWTFVSRIMSAFQHTSRFIIAFLLGSSCFLIPWLQSPSTVILEPKKKKLVTVLCYVALVVSNSFVMLWTVTH